MEDTAALGTLLIFCAGTYFLFRWVQQQEQEMAIERREYKALYERMVVALEQKGK